jgi:hypothetical protein
MDDKTFSITGDMTKDIGERIAMARHFSSIGQNPFFQQIDSVDPPRVASGEANVCCWVRTPTSACRRIPT